MIENRNIIDFSNNFNLILNKIDENVYEIKFPKKGYTFLNIYSFFFEIVGMIGLAFLTIKISNGGIIIAFLSTSFFWYIIIKQTIGNIIYLFEKQTLLLIRDQFTLEKKMFNKSSIVSGLISDIDSLSLKNSGVSFKNYVVLKPRLLFLSILKQSEKMGSFDIPVMNIDDKEVMFFEALKYDEQKWIVDTLNEYICSVKNNNCNTSVVLI